MQPLIPLIKTIFIVAFLFIQIVEMNALIIVTVRFADIIQICIDH